MDAIESARQEAEKLHLAAIRAGGDISNPLAFASAEAERRDIELCALPADDPQLKGGRAVYDSHGDTILYENCGSDFERAFLIAHEIAHLVLEGGEEDFIAEDVDAARSSEEPAVGVERVLDYGSHEHREVVMDIFAREFLLPRSLLRRWHIDENTTSLDIANRIGAPHAVVQQQLLDALLLPANSIPVQSIAKKPSEPDQSQVDAADHRGTPYQLQAGPGTGKTTTLVRRVLGLLDEGVEPASILVLTFSNKAAGELRERIAAKAPEAVATLWIGTFHAFGLDIIHRFNEPLGLSDNPSVIGRYEAIELLEDELTKLPLKHYQNVYDPTLNLNDMLSAISRAKDEVVNATRYRELAESMRTTANSDDQRLQAEKCLEVAALYERYEQLLKARDALDFGDLVLLPTMLVETNERVSRSLAERHQHILVDEYQDVNRASVRLLKAIAGKGEKLWVVGDSCQSIYRFRGASSINMQRFIEDFPGAKAEQLAVNYRSVAEVINLYSTFSTNMKASVGVLPLNLDPKRGGSGELPEFRVAGKPDDEIAAIAAAIEEKIEQGFAYEKQAVLCTSNARLSEVAGKLEHQGIPVLYLGSLFERAEIRDLLSLLSLLVDKRALGLIRAAGLPSMTMTVNDVQSVSQYIKEKDLPALGWVDCIDDINPLSDAGRKSLQHLISVLHGFSKQDSPWSVLATLVIDRLGIAKEIAQSDQIQKRMQGIAIWQLLNFCRKRVNGRGLLIERLLFRIRRIVQLSEDRDIRQLPQAAMNLQGVRLMTIHASKGLEFDVVHLPGMISTGLPGNNKSPNCLPPDGLIEGTEELTGKEAIKRGHDEEEECKFFVAASRARDRLILYASSVQNSGKNRSPSKYIERICGYIQQINQPSLLSANDAPAQLIATDTGDGLLISDKQLGLYNGCPRRFLYTHGLALGGKRTESAFLQMHNVVYDVIDWLKTSYPESNPAAAELDEQFQRSWHAKGPVDHGYAEDYQRIGYRLVEFLLETRQDKQLVKPEELQLSFPDGVVTVLPDEVFVDESGRHSIRRIKTGKQRSNEFDQLEYSVLLEAAERRFGKGTEVEAVHLAGETQEAVSITDKKRGGRLEKSSSALTAISGGSYSAAPSTRGCPTCPNFFICGDVPQGKVTIKK
ncbi:UvrD-helicase domain-containing protein [Pontibacter sp. JAM-7]|uniref:UvrD-helicase domain-containing protein n=1 Tax=Pontibacter sp. JAM-7 TaxID=3366581 RepID=UPI003AF6D835